MPHDDFLTILIGDRELGNNRLVSYFDKVIFHDEIAHKVAVYPET